MAFESVKDEIPVSLHVLELCDRFAHGFSAGGSELIDALAAAFCGVYQTGLGQQSGMFTDSRTADRKTRGEFPRPVRRICEAPKNLSASWVAERSYGPIQRHNDL